MQREGCHGFVAGELARRGVNVSWIDRVEYVDDDRAGDDFIGRAAEPEGAREVHQALLPEGIAFYPAEVRGLTGRTRRVWRVRGRATLGRFTLGCDPTGICADLDLQFQLDKKIDR